MTRREEMADVFRALHEAYSGFVMPNAWDAGSAVVLARAGFPAIATTSAGIAFSLGRPDYDVRDARLAVAKHDMFDRIRQITEAAGKPVNGDLEAGYGDSPEAVADTIRIAIDAGLAGGNIEDKMPDAGGLYEETLAIDRIRAARAAIDAHGSSFVLTARTDAFQTMEHGALRAAIRRANLYREGGADVLYAPGVNDIAIIGTLAREIEGPLNAVLGLGLSQMSVGALFDAGVKRISLGGSMARSMLGFLAASARELREHGSISFAGNQISQAELNAMFAEARGQ
jgi:2-methylisocitrate lyase-like PEP mutase family enzyme